MGRGPKQTTDKCQRELDEGRKHGGPVKKRRMCVLVQLRMMYTILSHTVG